MNLRDFLYLLVLELRLGNFVGIQGSCIFWLPVSSQVLEHYSYTQGRDPGQIHRASLHGHCFFMGGDRHKQVNKSLDNCGQESSPMLWGLGSGHRCQVDSKN